MCTLNQLARDVFCSTLDAINIPETMGQKLARSGSRITVGSVVIDLSDYDRIFAVSVGKASVALARGLVEVLAPERSVEGIIIAPHDALQPVPGFKVLGAGHPLPDAGSLEGAREVLHLLAGCNDERSLVFLLLSGGGSAMLEFPINADLTLEDIRHLNQALVECGAPIEEINAVRKHLSAIKGGRLAAIAPKAMKITLGVSDVPYGRETALASGPTLPDPTTIADAHEVMKRYDLLAKFPVELRAKFNGAEMMRETPKMGDAAFDRAYFALLLGMDDLFRHATQAAVARGFIVACDNTTDDWPVSQAADYLLNKLEQLHLANPGKRVALIADGELSSPVIGHGVGGRNSAFVLECVGKIVGTHTTVLSGGTDGRDGSSLAAGAIADGATLERARAVGLDPEDFYQRSDSYNFFHALGDTIETGPTGNNLRDLRILMTE